MKSHKFDIGQNVFIVEGGVSVEKCIVSIIKTNDNVTKFQLSTSYCSEFNENRIFRTKILCDLHIGELLSKAIFKVGDIVFILERGNIKHIDKWDIGGMDIIQKITTDMYGTISYYLVNSYEYSFNEQKLSLVPKEHILEVSFITEKFKEIEKLQKKSRRNITS